MTLWYVSAVGSLSVLPFLAVRLTEAGMSESEAAWTLASLPLSSLLAGPGWSWVADRSGRARELHRGAIALAAAFLLLLWMASSLVAATLAIAGFALGRCAIFPLADTATSHALGSGYGRVRGIGSIGYIVSMLFVGSMRDHDPDIPLFVSIGLLSLAFCLAPWLPALPPTPENEHRQPWTALLKIRPFRSLLWVCFFNGLSLTTYDHLFTLYMDGRGVPSWVTGAAIAWGVAVEVVVMVWGARLLERVPWKVLLLIALGSGIPRFLGTAFATHTLTIALLQGLHGLQFGLFWIVIVRLATTLAPPSLRNSAQALLPAVGFGLAPLTALVASGTWLQFADTQRLFAVLVVPAIVATLLASRLQGSGTLRA